MYKILENHWVKFFNEISETLKNMQILMQVDSDSCVISVPPIFDLVFKNAQESSLWELHLSGEHSKQRAGEIENFLCELLEEKTHISQLEKIFFNFIVQSVVCNYPLMNEIYTKKLSELSYNFLFVESRIPLREHEIIIQVEENKKHKCLTYIQENIRFIKTRLHQSAVQKDLLRWYFLRYEKFSPTQYFTFYENFSPFIQDLLRWELENKNRLLWFLYWQDLTGIDQSDYFGYEKLKKIELNGTLLFPKNALIKKLFSLPSCKFRKILDLIFIQDYPNTFCSVLALNLALDVDEFYFDDIYSVILNIPDLEYYNFNIAFINQYIKSLKLLLEFQQKMNADWNTYIELTDFIFGHKIENFQYTSTHNLEEFHPNITLKSALRKSQDWHSQSLWIEMKDDYFSYEPKQIEFNGVHFELISNPEKLRDEAHVMQHCVLTYREKIKKRQYFCFRVWSDNFRGTLGLIYDDQTNSYEFNQLTTFKNASAPDRYLYSAQALAQYLTITKTIFE